MKYLKGKLTVCIPTCYGEVSLITAVNSIVKSAGDNVKIIVLADSVPLSDEIKKSLDSLNVLYKENKTPSSQISKIKQLLNMVKTEYVIFTQDDISVPKNAFEELDTFIQNNQNLTMFTVRNTPTKPTTLVDYSLTGGTLIANYIEKNWYKGQNYLNGCGRFLGFKTEFMKKFRLPEKIVNVDAYLYFENSRLGGSFNRCWDAVMFYTLPRSLQEQIRKSSRYQYGHEELMEYFTDINKQLTIPLNLKIQGLMNTSLKHPLNIAAYIPFLVITRLIRQKKRESSNVMWEVDQSTK